MSALNLPTILPPDFTPYWKKDLHIDEYHRDRTFISSTSIRLYLESPLHFYWFFVLGRDIKTSDSMDFGNLAHVCILEPDRFRSLYKVMPNLIGKTKDGRESERSAETKRMREEWIADQDPTTIIVTQAEFEKLEFMLQSITKHRAAKFLLQDGVPEMSGYYRDPITGIACRIRPDFLKYSMKAMVDLKTCRSPKHGPFRKQVEMLNYDAQIAMYNFGFEQIERYAIDASHFMAIQSEAPFDTCVWSADPALLEIGNKKFRFALDGIARCMKTGVWPGYQPEGLAQNMSPSDFSMSASVEEYE